MMKETYILTKTTALLFLYNEFATDNLKLTVEVDEDGCFKNHIEVEGTEELSLDSEYFGYLMDCAKHKEKEKERGRKNGTGN